jgi:hypothetical protein
MAQAQTIRSPSTGMTRRTFVAKEWGVVVQQDEASRCALLTFKTEAKARAVCAAIGRKFGPEVHYVERLEVAR